MEGVPMTENVSLAQRIQNDIKLAMKSGEKRKLETLRMVLADIKKEEIQKAQLKDEDVLTLIKRNVKTRQESIAQFEKGGRPDLVEKEKAEIEILKIYLPSQLTPEALKAAVQEVIGNLKVTSKKDMGLVMKTVLGQYGSQVDGKQVQAVVMQLLN